MSSACDISCERNEPRRLTHNAEVSSRVACAHLLRRRMVFARFTSHGGRSAANYVKHRELVTNLGAIRSLQEWQMAPWRCRLQARPVLRKRDLELKSTMGECESTRGPLAVYTEIRQLKNAVVVVTAGALTCALRSHVPLYLVLA